MSKIDYQKLREIAEKTKIAGEAPVMPFDQRIVMPFDQRINALNDFMKHFSPDIALALLDEINALEETRINDVCRIAELTKQLELAKSKLNEQREYYEGVISDGSKRIAELEAWVEYTRAAYVRAKDKGDLIRVITRQPTGFYAYVPCN